MTKASKTRVSLLALTIFTTLFAVTAPKRAQACYPYEVDLCYQSNGNSCWLSDCPTLSNCDGTQSGCVYYTERCCPPT